MSREAPGATEDYSSRTGAIRPASIGVLGLALVGAALLVAALLSTVVKVSVGGVVRFSQHGHDRHGWALLLLAIAAVVIGVVAARRRTPAAAIALVALGVVVLAIALASDLPDSRSTGVYGVRYENARASAGAGLMLELLGGAALVLAGVAGFSVPRPRPRRAVAAEL